GPLAVVPQGYAGHCALGGCLPGCTGLAGARAGLWSWNRQPDDRGAGFGYCPQCYTGTFAG
ncbi:hypothetical protein, partial [Vibrio cholerae]|uniref:hypothetical protein n=1 Tax=Vibrio cholerae TaxID=666 RepID=UPI001C112297